MKVVLYCIVFVFVLYSTAIQLVIYIALKNSFD